MFAYRIKYRITEADKPESTGEVIAHYPSKHISKRQAFSDLALFFPRAEGLVILEVSSDISVVDFKFPIKSLGFSKRTQNCLVAADIDYLEQVAKMTEKQIMRLRNFGNKGMMELREAMKKHDIRFYEPPLYKFKVVEKGGNL